MACDTCSTPAKSAPVAALTYTATSSTVVGKDGLRYQIRKSLVPAGRKPSGGWKVALPVNGQTITAEGASAEAVFAEATRILGENKIAVTELDLWLNLNLQWVRRAPEKYQIVRESDLLGVAVSSDGAVPMAPTRARTPVGPAVWGRKGWGAMQQYLAQDIYEYGEFMVLATMIRKWLDPVVNPTIGCAECWLHFGTALADLRTRPRYTQDEARRWLWAVMNGANVRKGAKELTFEEAATLNHWT